MVAVIGYLLASWGDRWTAVGWLLVWLVVCLLFIRWCDRLPADDDKVSDDEA